MIVKIRGEARRSDGQADHKIRWRLRVIEEGGREERPGAHRAVLSNVSVKLEGKMESQEETRDQQSRQQSTKAGH